VNTVVRKVIQKKLVGKNILKKRLGIQIIKLVKVMINMNQMILPGKTNLHNLNYFTHIYNNADLDIMKYMIYNSNSDVRNKNGDNKKWYVDSLANMAFTGNSDLI